MASSLSVLYAQHQLQVRSSLTPQQVLLNNVHGSYTTALVTPKMEVVDWHLHKQRLERNLMVMNTSVPERPFQPLLDALDAKGLSVGSYLQSEVAPAVRAALQAYDTLLQETRAAQEQQRQEQEQQAQAEAQSAGHPPPILLQPAPLPAHAMLVVCIAPPPPLPPAGAEPPRPEGAAQPASLWPAAVSVYCKPASPALWGSEHAVEVALIGSPRRMAGAKHNSWVMERRRWEAMMPPGCAEVLLSDSDGNILEGLTTNFFTISASGPGTPPSEALLCSSSLSQSALAGVTQARVLQAAHQLGMRVADGAPKAAGRHSWREAFITNCVKGVQPVKRVFCPQGNAWGADPWDIWLPEPAGPHTVALRQAIHGLEERTPWSSLD